MAGIVVLTGSADLTLLKQAVPEVPVHEADTIDSVAPEQAATATILIVRSGAHLDAGHLNRWPALRHLIRAGSGLDGLDLDALAARSISVHRNREPAADAVAEWALAAILALARRIPFGQAALTTGSYEKAACLAPPVSRMRLAIWGAGPLGRACGRVLDPFVAATVYAHRPTIGPELPQRSARDLTAWADIHLVALPLTVQTTGMFGTDLLNATAERNPLLVCVGRLGTLDVPECIQALAEHRLSGLALDPIDQQDLPLLPTGGPPLNLLLTPHIGAQRSDVRAVLDTWVADTARALIEQDSG